jgi:adenine-specific DNA-methyltransferase
VLNQHYISNNQPLTFAKLVPVLNSFSQANQDESLHQRATKICEYLSALPGIPGFIYQNYSCGGTQNAAVIRQYFSDDNAQKCDAIRTKIEEWHQAALITANEYFFLLASLIESIDKYANTASVYGAFLKNIKKTAQKQFVLQPVPLILSNQQNQVFNQDANQLIAQIQPDILYLDPPYNHRQYYVNYHLLETIAKYDNPLIYGKTGLRQDRSAKSLYCSRTKAKRAFIDLIFKAKAKYIFLSYSNEGLLNFDDIKSVMSLRGKYGVFTKEYDRFIADKTTSRIFKAQKTTEYLHYVICDKLG